MTMVQTLFNWIGGFVCHQLPDRSFFIDGRALPVCARCTGIYTGVFVTAVFLLIARRARGNKVFSVGCGILIAGLITPMILDGVSSYSNLRETTNAIRLVTGALFGVCLPALALLAYQYDFKMTHAHTIVKAHELAALAVAAAALSLGAGAVGWFLMSAAICVAIITLFAGLFCLLRKRVWRGVIKRGKTH